MSNPYFPEGAVTVFLPDACKLTVSVKGNLVLSCSLDSLADKLLDGKSLTRGERAAAGAAIKHFTQEEQKNS